MTTRAFETPLDPLLTHVDDGFSGAADVPATGESHRSGWLGRTVR
jgi:hypothetical protein